MQFLIISKKENFKSDYINENILNSIKAPSLISDDVIKFELNNFEGYLYTYNHIFEEKEHYSYHIDKNRVLIVNGICNIDNNFRDEDIVSLFDKLNIDSEIIGDYQLISLDNDGNGFCKTPLSSVRKLFYYEDDYCSIISSELKLIVDGVSKFSKSSFAHNYDLTFMYDTFHSGAFLKFPRHTIFKNIKRIFPHDELIIKKFNFLIVKNESISPPSWFIDLYETDKEFLYDWYYEKLLNYTEMFLLQFKDKLEYISMGLTGGFDFRLTAMILNEVCKKLEIKFKTFTHGDKNHPDVVIASQIAKCLNLDWEHVELPSKIFPACQNIGDYRKSLFITQGDFDSRDFIEPYERNLNNMNVLNQDDSLSTVHKRQPFYWNYEFILHQLGPTLKENFNYLSSNELEILKKAGINELDFVLLKDIAKKLKYYQKDIKSNNKKVIHDLITEFRIMKDNSLYPKNETFIEFKKDENYGYTSRLTQWMDYACAADASSFIELERNSPINPNYDNKTDNFKKNILHKLKLKIRL